MNARPRGARRAFTLIELLTVIAIIGVLAAILIPVVGSVRKSAKAGADLSNLRQIGQAMMLYANDNKYRINQVVGVYDASVPGSDAFYWGRAARYLGTGKSAPTTTAELQALSRPFESLTVPARYFAEENGTKFCFATNQNLLNSGASTAYAQMRRLSEVANPSTTLYAVVGWWRFSPASKNAANPAAGAPSDGDPVNTTQAVYWPYKNRTIAVYLDGHTGYLGTAITNEMVKLK